MDGVTHFAYRPFSGLTKRELFAAMMAQGIVGTMSSTELSIALRRISKEKGMEPEQYIAEMAVKQADDLIEALNERKEQS
jgi:hypothetical protein